LDDFNDPLGPGNVPESVDLGEDGNLDGLGGNANFWEEFPVWQTVTAVIILIIAGIFMYIAHEFNRRVESDIGRSYTRLGSWANWLGILIRPVHTPYERADMLTTAVPEGSGPIRNLTQQFVLRQFSQKQASESAFEPVEQWKELRPILLRKGINNRLMDLRARFRRRR
jgi:hypothetical protein